MYDSFRIHSRRYLHWQESCSEEPFNVPVHVIWSWGQFGSVKSEESVRQYEVFQSGPATIRLGRAHWELQRSQSLASSARGLLRLSSRQLLCNIYRCILASSWTDALPLRIHQVKPLDDQLRVKHSSKVLYLFELGEILPGTRSI